MFNRKRIKELEEELQIQCELIQNIKFATKIPEPNHKNGDEIWIEELKTYYGYIHQEKQKVIILDSFFCDKTFEWIYFFKYKNNEVDRIGELNFSKLIKN